MDSTKVFSYSNKSRQSGVAMARCKYCGTSGFFLRVSTNGLCDNCELIVVMDIKNRARIFNDSIRLVESSENPDVVFSRIKLAIETAQELLKYERLGITTINPTPSTIIRTLNSGAEKALLETFNKARNSLTKDLSTLKSPDTKRNRLNKFVEKINEYIPRVKNQEGLLEMRQGCFDQISKLETETNKNRKEPKKGSPPSTTLAIKVSEVHPAKLLFMEAISSETIRAGGGFRIMIRMSTDLKAEIIGPNEPSIIYKDLPVAKPKSPALIDKPPYFPSYGDLSPQQRWIYLNWLEDICKEIDIGYVFIYYYGLERHLLLVDCQASILG